MSLQAFLTPPSNSLSKNATLSRLSIALASTFESEENQYFVPDSTEPSSNYDDEGILWGSNEGYHIDSHLGLLLNLLNDILNKIEEWAREVFLPELLDAIINLLFSVAEKKNREPFFSFRDIYELFQVFGLKDIKTKTLNRLSNALLLKKCSTRWIDPIFFRNLYLNLSEGASDGIKEAALDLYQSMLTMETEERREAAFRDEINKFLSVY